MSVFHEFQKLWADRFPQNEDFFPWEDDVRTLLNNHRNKISELQKELEQENLYCIYLEKLLSDVEKIKTSSNGGGLDAAAAAPPTTSETDQVTISYNRHHKFLFISLFHPLHLVAS